MRTRLMPGPGFGCVQHEAAAGARGPADPVLRVHGAVRGGRCGECPARSLGPSCSSSDPRESSRPRDVTALIRAPCCLCLFCIFATLRLMRTGRVLGAVRRLCLAWRRQARVGMAPERAGTSPLDGESLCGSRLRMIKTLPCCGMGAGWFRVRYLKMS